MYVKNLFTKKSVNLYYIFYCRAYYWYARKEKTSKESLRLSAISLLSAIPLFNGLTIVCLISVLNKHTPGNKWLAVAIGITVMILNSLLIDNKKSDELREQYLQFPDSKKKKISFYFFLYLVLTVIGLISAMLLIAYYKHKYGNYDHIYN